MKRWSKFNVLLVVMLVVGISLAVAGCDLFKKDNPTTPQALPTATPAPTTITLLNTSVAVNENTFADGIAYSAQLYFTPTAGRVINISASGPANVDIDLFVYFPNGNLAYSATGTTLGSERIPAFVATVGAQYRLRIRAYTQVGCTINVLVTPGS